MANSTLDVYPTKKEQLIKLNESGSSWVSVRLVEEPVGLSIEEFEQLWLIKPEKQHEIKIAGRVIKCPRYSATYLKNYRFSGLNHEPENHVPPRISQLLEDSKKNRTKFKFMFSKLVYINRINWSSQ